MAQPTSSSPLGGVAPGATQSSGLNLQSPPPSPVITNTPNPQYSGQPSASSLGVNLAFSSGSSNAQVQRLPWSSFTLDTTVLPSTLLLSTPVSGSSSVVAQSVSSGGSSATPSSTSAAGGGGSFSDRAVWPTWQIPKSITGNHVPMIVSRGFIVFATPFYHQLMTYDPIRQLTSSGGASGAALAGSNFSPLHIGILTAHIGSAFLAGSFGLDTNYCDVLPAPNDLNPCPPRMSVTPWAIDVVLTCLAIQVVVILYAASKWFQKPSGLSADPTTIAGVAAVMGHPEIERQFSVFPGDISQQELKESIKNQQFKLGTFVAENGMMKYGIMPAPDDKDKKTEPGFFSKIGASLGGLSDKATFLRDWKRSRLYTDLIFAAFLLSLLGLTASALARIDRPQTVFLATASASGTGMKIFFAALGITVSFYWGKLFQGEQRVSLMMAMWTLAMVATVRYANLNPPLRCPNLHPLLSTQKR